MSLECYDGNKFDTISQAIEAYIDGADYERGAVETAQSTANNAGKCLGNLVQLLVEKGVLTKKEVEDKVLVGLYL